MILTVSGLPATGIAGIDLSFFTLGPNFRGIKHLPAGPHIFHYGESVESLRHAVLFEDSTHLVYKDANLDYGPVTEPDQRLMLEYPASDDWKLLSSFVDFKPRIIDTLTPLEKFEMPKKTWPDGSIGSERTEYYLDKTWYVLQQDVNRLTGDFQLSFLLFILCRNPQAEMNWHMIMELLFSCRKGLEEADWSLYLLRVLRTQLKVMPEDYRDEELPFLENALRNLYINMNGLATHLDVSPVVEVQAQHLLSTLGNWGADWSVHDELEPQEDNFTKVG